MNWILETVLTGSVTFAATNIDDLFVLLLFFSQVDGELLNWHVVLGQYLGFAALVALSLIGSFSVLVVPQEWIGVLGLLPIFLGIRALTKLRSESEESKPIESSGIYSVAAVTFANGGDNIAIYVPRFASTGFASLGIIILVFFFLIAVWCCAGYKLGSHPLIANRIERYEHIVVPVILIGLGVYILTKSGVLSLL